MEGNLRYARNLLAKYSIDLIRNHPLIGVGIGNDRILLFDKMRSIYFSSKLLGGIRIIFGAATPLWLLYWWCIIIFILKIYIAIIKNTDTDAIDVICIFMIGFFLYFYQKLF